MLVKLRKFGTVHAMRNFRHFRWCNLGRILNKLNRINSSSLMSALCLNVCRLCACVKYYELGCMFKKIAPRQSWRVCAWYIKQRQQRHTASKFALFSVSALKVETLLIKQTYIHENWSIQTLFWSILNISAKYHQNRSLKFRAIYRFKVDAFFWDTCTVDTHCSACQ